MTSLERPSSLDQVLRILADVRPGEGRLAVLLALNIFFILTTSYVLKPVREALILGEGSPELKTYLSVGQVALLSVAVPYYARLAARLHRRALMNVVTYFFVAWLVIFYVVAQAGVSIGIAYFLWIGVFNLMIIAQFWSFANDLYTRDEGERLFPVVGLGGALGAVLGAIIASRLIRSVGIYQLLLVGAVLLAAVTGHELRGSANVRTRGQRETALEEGRRNSPCPYTYERLRTGGSNAVPAAHRDDVPAERNGRCDGRVHAWHHRHESGSGSRGGRKFGRPGRVGTDRRVLFTLLCPRQHH